MVRAVRRDTAGPSASARRAPLASTVASCRCWGAHGVSARRAARGGRDAEGLCGAAGRADRWRRAAVAAARAAAVNGHGGLFRPASCPRGQELLPRGPRLLRAHLRS